MQISSRAVMFWGCRWATRTFNSLQRFSMGLRSGDWLGHSRTLKCFLRSHSFVARAVCLGSLSCWKTQPRFIFNALADGRRFSLKISRYMAPFILSFTQISRPGPFAEKQPQSMMFPPPCFTVGMVFFGCNSAFFLLQTRQVEFLPKSSILVSSDHMTFSQSSSGSSKCSLANFRRAWTCTGLSRGTRLARRSVLLMVAFWRFSTAWYGTVRYRTVHFWGVFHWVLYLVPDTFLVPLRSRFHASRTVTKTWRVNSADHWLAGENRHYCITELATRDPPLQPDPLDLNQHSQRRISEQLLFKQTHIFASTTK